MNKRKGLDLVICGCGGQGNILASRIVADALMQRGEHVKTAETIGMAQRGGSVASHVRGGRPQSPLVPKKCADTLIAFEPGEALRSIDYLAVYSSDEHLTGGCSSAGCLPIKTPANMDEAVENPAGCSPIENLDAIHRPALIVNTRASQPPTASLQRACYDGKEALGWLKNYTNMCGQKMIAFDASNICKQVGSAKVLNIVMLAAACKADALDGLSRQELEDAIKRRVKERFWNMNLQAVDLVFAQLKIN